MSACQNTGVAGTSLSPEGNITTTTDVLKIVRGVVNTCPAVLQSALAAALKLGFFFSVVVLLFAQCFVLLILI